MAEETHVTEKVYCYDHPSAYKSDNSAALCAAMMNANRNQTDPALMASMMNGGMNGQWNNPFIYLVWMMFANRFWNNGNAADVAGDNYNSRQIAALQDTVNTNHNNDLAIAAINGNREALGQLAQTFNTDISNMQQSICAVKSAIEQVGGTVGYTSESIKNAIALGDRDIIQQMCNCCCQTKTAILEQGYQNQLANERQTGVLGSKMDNNHAADQLQQCQSTSSILGRIDQLANGVQTGFANLGYQNERNTASIIQNATANTQRVLDAMCAQTTQSLRDQIADKDRSLQTQTIINQLRNECCCCNN